MTNVELKYPVLLIKENDKPLYFFSKSLGLISKGGKDFYKGNIKIIDAIGIEYKLNKANLHGNAKILDSLRYFQPMYQMSLIMEKIGEYELSELKAILIERIKKHPKYWVTLDSIEGIEESINQKKNFSELIVMFK